MLSPYLSAGVSKKVARLLVLVTQLEAVPLYEWTHVSGMQPRERLVPTYTEIIPDGQLRCRFTFHAYFSYYIVNGF